MAKGKNPTTVNLTESAEIIREKLSPVFGLKNVLSAGLILFDRLSAQHQKDIIAQANSQKPAQKDRKLDINQAIEDVKYYVKFKLPGPEESKRLQDLRKTLEAETGRKKKKKA